MSLCPQFSISLSPLSLSETDHVLNSAHISVPSQSSRISASLPVKRLHASIFDQKPELIETRHGFEILEIVRLSGGFEVAHFALQDLAYIAMAMWFASFGQNIEQIWRIRKSTKCALLRVQFTIFWWNIFSTFCKVLQELLLRLYLNKNVRQSWHSCKTCAILMWSDDLCCHSSMPRWSISCNTCPPVRSLRCEATYMFALHTRNLSPYRLEEIGLFIENGDRWSR